MNMWGLRLLFPELLVDRIMERGLSSWGLSFASQIDFPPLWPGTSPPRRLLRLCSSGSGTSLMWSLPTKETVWCAPHHNAGFRLWLPCLNATLPCSSSPPHGSHPQSSTVQWVPYHTSPLPISQLAPLYQGREVSVHPKYAVTCHSPGGLICRLPWLFIWQVNSWKIVIRSLLNYLRKKFPNEG